MSKVGILDLSCGNLSSLQNCITRLGVESELICSSFNAADYSHVILPGVGSFPFVNYIGVTRAELADIID